MIDQPIQDRTDRTTRHLEMLEELAALAMTLTRTAAAKAQADLEAPKSEPEPGPDPVLTFTRLARTVRQVIALEARIATPIRRPTNDAPASYAPAPAYAIDPARELIAEAARDCAKADPAATRRHGPTRTHIERHIDERIDADDITALIDDDASVYEIIATICEDLGVRCEAAEQPDDFLIPLTEALHARRTARTPQDTSDLDPDDDADDDPEDDDPDDDPDDGEPKTEPSRPGADPPIRHPRSRYPA